MTDKDKPEKKSISASELLFGSDSSTLKYFTAPITGGTGVSGTSVPYGPYSPPVSPFTTPSYPVTTPLPLHTGDLQSKDELYVEKLERIAKALEALVERFC